ncbi:MAG: hypothetical protein ACOYYS_11420 [Chloroflexota bacterium]
MANRFKDALLTGLATGLAALVGAFFLVVVLPTLRSALVGPGDRAGRLVLDIVAVAIAVSLAMGGSILLWKYRTRLVQEGFPNRISLMTFVYLLIVFAYIALGCSWAGVLLRDIRSTNETLNFP